MTQLPSQIAELTAPRSFSPSQLAVARDCALRAVLATEHNVTRLDAHPAAAIGSALHELVEKAARGELAGDTRPKALDKMLSSILETARRKLEAQTGRRAPDLTKIYPALVWRKRKQAAFDVASRFLGQAQVPRIGGAKRRVEFTLLPLNGRWIELPVESASLRLHGRIDILIRRNNEFTIRDLKTGRVTDDTGEIAEHIAVQMQLYGLIILDQYPGSKVSLVVDHGSDSQVAFGDEIVANVKESLLQLLSGLPPGVRTAAVTLASPGKICWGCLFRHICPAYLRWAPRAWQEPTAFRLPFDTWGVLRKSVARPNGLLDLDILDAADRHVRVFGLRRDDYPEAVGEGDFIWIFGLASSDRAASASLRHPLNFYQVPASDGEEPAWTLQAFGA